LRSTGPARLLRQFARPGRYGWLLAAVWVASFGAVFYAWPVSQMLADGFSTDAWRQTARGGDLASVITFTVWQAALSTVAALALAAAPIWALRRLSFRGRSFVLTLLLVPFVVPTVVAVSATLSLFRPDGALSAVLGALPGGWFDDLNPRGHLWSIVLLHAWFNVGMVVRVVLAFDSAAGRRHDEAAAMLGASPLRRMLQVTGPRLAPAWRAAAALTFLLSVSAFATVLLLGGISQRTLETEIYRETTQFLSLDRAAVFALCQFGVVAVALAVIRGRTSTHSTLTSATPAATKRRGTLRNASAVAVVCGAVVFAIAPLVSLSVDAFRPGSAWGLDGFRHLGAARANTTAAYAAGEAVSNSLQTAAVATTIAMAIGAATAALAARRGAFGKVAGFLSIAPLATSPVTLGFGMMLALAAPPFDFRSKWWLLPVAHALVGIPLVVRTLGPTLANPDRARLDAARTLGARPLRRWAKIELPRLAPAAALSVGLAFVVSLGEFGASSFLARPQHLTIPIAIGRALGRPGERSLLDAQVLSFILIAVTFAALLTAEAASIVLRRVITGAPRRWRGSKRQRSGAATSG